MAPTGEIKIAELKELFGVTEMTLRRDLVKLEQLGLLRRIFGGAILIGKDVALQVRTGVLTEEKRRIGQAAAAFVAEGDAIFIDGGSTTLQVARSLKPGMNVTVVTNALNIAAELLARRISTIMVGGILLENASTSVGPIAAGTISKMAFDRVFLGTPGVTAKHGFSNSNLHETELKQLAMAHSAEVNIVTDDSKFGKSDLFSFASLGEAHRIIADRPPDDGELAADFEESRVSSRFL